MKHFKSNDNTDPTPKGDIIEQKHKFQNYADTDRIVITNGEHSGQPDLRNVK